MKYRSLMLSGVGLTFFLMFGGPLLMTWGGEPTWWQHVMKALLSWSLTLLGGTFQSSMPSYVFVALILFNGFC